MSDLPDFISDECDLWFAALVPTREEAVAVFERNGLRMDDLDDELQEIRLACAEPPEGCAPPGMKLPFTPSSAQAIAAARKRNVTGLCDREEHRFCSGRVYRGHDGDGSIYEPCACPCHSEETTA